MLLMIECFERKVKSALIKAKKQTVKKSDKSDLNSSNLDLNKDNPNVRFATLIQQKFPDSLQCEINEDYIGIKPDHWLDVAQWLKSDPRSFFRLSSMCYRYGYWREQT